MDKKKEQFYLKKLKELQKACADNRLKEQLNEESCQEVLDYCVQLSESKVDWNDSAAELKERVKEQGCLYNIMDTLYQAGDKPFEVLKKAIDLIPSGFRWPEKTSVKLEINGNTYTAGHFLDTKHLFECPFNETRVPKGRLSVCVHNPGAGEPILPEEKNLICKIAELFSIYFMHEKMLINLQKSEAYFRSVFDNNPDAVYLFNLDGVFVNANKILEKVTEMPLEEIIGNHFRPFIHPDDIDRVLAHFKKAVNGEVQHYETRIITAKGNQKNLEVTKSPIIVNNEIIGVYGISKDVTRFREVEQLLDKAYKTANIGSWEVDIQGNTLYWSPFVKILHEVEDDYEPNLESALSFYIKEDHREQITDAVYTAIKTGEPFDVELKIITAKGNERWIRTVGQAEIRDGKCVRIFGTTQNINKRKLAEIESLKNKHLLEAIANQTKSAIWVRDIDGYYLLVNKEWKRILDLQNQEIIGKNLTQIHDQETAEHFKSNDMLVFDSEVSQFFLEEVHTPTGDNPYLTNLFPLFSIPGLPKAVGGIATDITDLKETEDKLQKAEERLLDIIEHSTNLFYRHTIEHEITYISPQAKDFFGFSPEEVKKRWTEFATDHPVNKKGFENTETAIKTGKPQPPYELQLRNRNGEHIWVEVNEAPIVKDGKTIAIVGSLTNITERNKAHTALKESLKEKETLLAEIHHRVKNNLAVIAGMMQLQAMSGDNEELNAILTESVLRIKSIANIHEHLYQSVSFSRINFTENIKELISAIIKTIQYETKVAIDYQCDEVELSVNQAIPFALIVNELITNALKHAFKGADNGIITIILTQKNNYVEFFVKDNGAGLPENFDFSNSNTLGMQLIATLSEQLEAEFGYGDVKKGAEFRLKFEKNDVSEIM